MNTIMNTGMNTNATTLPGVAGSGLRRGMDNARAAATEIVRQGTRNDTAAAAAGDADYARPLVGLRQAELQTQAATRIFQAWDQTVGTLLDIRA